MTQDPNPILQIYVNPVESEGKYYFSLLRSGAEAATQESSFGSLQKYGFLPTDQGRQRGQMLDRVAQMYNSALGGSLSLDYTGTTGFDLLKSEDILIDPRHSPGDLKSNLLPFFENIETASYGRIDLFLPDDPIAALDWEGFARGRMFRRATRDYSFRRLPISTPFRLGFISATPVNANTLATVAEAAAATAAGVELDVAYSNVGDWREFDNANRLGRFQAVHVLLETRFTPSGPMAIMGQDRVPIRDMLRSVAQHGVRCAVLQDVNEDPWAMAALRWGAQSLPADSETSVLLCSASPSPRFHDEMRGWYGSVFRDEPLDRCLAHLEPEYESCGVSLVAHHGAERCLDLREEVGMRRRSMQQIKADFARLAEPMAIAGAELGSSDTRAHPISTSDKPLQLDLEIAEDTTSPLTELAQIESIIQGTEHELKEQTSRLIADDQPRYPAAWFYHVDDAKQAPIPDTDTLTWPPPVGLVLEFHFWLDIVKTGIASITEIPSMSKPDQLPYPLELQVTVWSEELDFETKDRTIVLQAAGPTEHARFPIKGLASAPRQAELFVFIRYAGTLIAVFRVEAAITRDPEHREGAQVIEHAYLASDWFRFETAPSASALTIFITKKRGALHIFTFNPNACPDPWVALSLTENALYENNKGIYKAVQMLAGRAEQAKNQNIEFKFAKEARDLATSGFRLFGDIFLQGGTEAITLAEKYVQSLPEDSDLTIAIGREAENLYIPRGLLYDSRLPFDYFDTPVLNRFLGYRCNLSIRPSTPHDGFSPKRQLPVRMGAAWLEHEETSLLKEYYKQYEVSGKLNIEPVRAEDHALPILAAREFDLIEFYCHGHTDIPNVFREEEIKQFIKEYTESVGKDKSSSLLMAIDQARDSLLELNGGFVTLGLLGLCLKVPMPGRPLILLSMCESAQVSTGGRGFIPLFLRRGARAVIGTEGPTLWSLSREMDTGIVSRLLDGQSIGQAFYETRKGLAKTNVLALIYTLYGDAGAKLA